MIVYCSDFIDPHQVDGEFRRESDIAAELGTQICKMNLDELTAGNVGAALKMVKSLEGKVSAIYRGWMMTPSQYSDLYDGLEQKNYRLINTPEQFKHCHWLPDSYDEIEGDTPKSVWLPNGGDFAVEAILERLQGFQGRPVVLKDYVKSFKHYWEEACFIPDSSNADEVKRVVSTFLEYAYGEPQGGLVFREFIEFEPIGTHQQSGMPLTLEFRIFYLNGEPLSVYKYWDEGEYGISLPPLDEFNAIAKTVDSNFFTMDIAKVKDDGWLIVELGDGQVAGLPDNADISAFYQGLK